jgi:sulfatase modifying factor 1
MKITNVMAAVMAVTVMGTGVAWALPVVSDVTLAQRPNSRIVDITYMLAGEDAIVTVGIETNGIAIPDSAVTRLSGDVCKVVQTGVNKSIVWNAGEDWPENINASARARVTAWSTNAPPQYMVIDLEGGASAISYPVYYYTSAEAVPDGVTNYVYKTLRLAMRKIAPTGGSGFTMGSPVNELERNAVREGQVQVYLTQAYYIGVYELTQQQWEQVMATVYSWPSHWSNNDYKLTRPVEQASYYDVRENPSGIGSAISPNWPASSAVGATSFMGKLRAKTGLDTFDLPTEAQWEYASRAGTPGALNNGTMNITNLNSDANLALLGRYAYNGGKINGTTTPSADFTTANSTAAVGSYVPNAWGLYDMHGNVFEWCLDWMSTSQALPGGTDPKGATSSPTGRVRRSGSSMHPAKDCRTALRSYGGPNLRIGGDTGFRVARTLQP